MSETASEKHLRHLQRMDVLDLTLEGLGREDIAVRLIIEIEDVRLIQDRLVRDGFLSKEYGVRNG